MEEWWNNTFCKIPRIALTRSGERTTHTRHRGTRTSARHPEAGIAKACRAGCWARVNRADMSGSPCSPPSACVMVWTTPSWSSHRFVDARPVEQHHEWQSYIASNKQQFEGLCTWPDETPRRTAPIPSIEGTGLRGRCRSCAVLSIDNARLDHVTGARSTAEFGSLAKKLVKKR